MIEEMVNQTAGPSRGRTKAEGVSRMSTTTEKETAGKTKCGKCDLVVKDDDSSLNCEVCELWYHIRCENIPQEIYDFMVDVEEGQQFLWNCSFCKRGYENINKRLNRLEITQGETKAKHDVIDAELSEIRDAVKENTGKMKEVGDRLGELESKNLLMTENIKQDKLTTENRLSELERKVSLPLPTQEASSIRPAAEGQVNSSSQGQGFRPSSLMDEVNDRKARENNIVVYGVPEEASNNRTEEQEHDERFVQKVLSSCGVDDSTDKIRKVFRLGKLKVAGKQRPLLVQFRETQIKSDLYKNISRLKNEPEMNNITIRNDLTRLERQQEADLRREAKNMTEQAQTDGVVYGVRGPPWKRRVVKLRGHVPRV